MKPEPLESALESLESIVKEMESGELSLDALISKYESGIKLTKLCRERLSEATKRIDVITRSAGSEVALEPLDDDLEN